MTSSQGEPNIEGYTPTILSMPVNPMSLKHSELRPSFPVKCIVLIRFVGLLYLKLHADQGKVQHNDVFLFEVSTE